MRVLSTGGGPFDSEIVLYVVGELDLSSAPDLREALRNALVEGAGPVVIDCSRLTFIDAAGLGVLAWAANQAQHLRRSVELRNRSASIDEVLRVTGIDRRFASLASASPIAPVGALIA